MKQVQCDYCNGQGYFEWGIKRQITTDEAIDAGDIMLAGQEVEDTIRDPCNNCGGNGFLIVEP